MSTLKERLEEVMSTMSWEYGDLVAASGMSKSVVSQWLGRGSKPIHSIGRMDAAERLEAATGFAALWLATGKGEKRLAFGNEAERQAWQALARASMQARPVRESEERWLDRPGDTAGSLPKTRDRAQLVSPDAFTVPSELPWTTVQTTPDLPQSFILAAPDDSLAPEVPRGMRLLMERHDGGQLEPGDGVLVQTADGQRALRMYAQAAGGSWVAAAKHPAYASFHSQRDGLWVLAVLTGKLGRKV